MCGTLPRAMAVENGNSLGSEEGKDRIHATIWGSASCVLVRDIAHPSFLCQSSYCLSAKISERGSSMIYINKRTLIKRVLTFLPYSFSLSR